MSDNQESLKKEILQLGQKLRDENLDAAEIRRIGQELITLSGYPAEIKEFIPCPNCKGVNSITYGGGRPRACSTCNGFSSILNPDWVALKKPATISEKNVDVYSSQF